MKNENVKIYATTQPTDQNAKKNQQHISIRDETEFLFSKRESDDFSNQQLNTPKLKRPKELKLHIKLLSN